MAPRFHGGEASSLKTSPVVGELIGQPGEIRTPDPDHPKVVRYQTALQAVEKNYPDERGDLGLFNPFDEPKSKGVRDWCG